MQVWIKNCRSIFIDVLYRVFGNCDDVDKFVDNVDKFFNFVVAGKRGRENERFGSFVFN